MALYAFALLLILLLLLRRTSGQPPPTRVEGSVLRHACARGMRQRTREISPPTDTKTVIWRGALFRASQLRCASARRQRSLCRRSAAEGRPSAGTGRACKAGQKRSRGFGSPPPPPPAQGCGLLGLLLAAQVAVVVAVRVVGRHAAAAPGVPRHRQHAVVLTEVEGARVHAVNLRVWRNLVDLLRVQVETHLALHRRTPAARSQRRPPPCQRRRRRRATAAGLGPRHRRGGATWARPGARRRRHRGRRRRRGGASVEEGLLGAADAAADAAADETAEGCAEGRPGGGLVALWVPPARRQGLPFGWNLVDFAHGGVDLCPAHGGLGWRADHVCRLGWRPRERGRGLG
mmetsp:Transcript_139061/g.352563  ORF Transcript_139061/g.352563 Transcript_139061/m.352563 type:complete len:346 (+) Transcript_139061:199-1236(+)